MRCSLCSHEMVLFSDGWPGNAEESPIVGAALVCVGPADTPHFPMWVRPEDANNHDPVDHPKHYTQHPSGVECIDIVEHMNFNKGNAMKYLWRAGDKGDEVEDLRKSAWYINREIERLTRE